MTRYQLSLSGSQHVLAVRHTTNFENLPADSNERYLAAMARLYAASSGSNVALGRVISSGRTLWGDMEPLRESIVASGGRVKLKPGATTWSGTLAQPVTITAPLGSANIFGSQ